MDPVSPGMNPSPPRRPVWLPLSAGALAWLIVSALVGTAGGVGTYTFYYADGASYLSNDAKACANCHVMQEHYDAWIKSSHRHVAACNDCHAPHDSFTGKWYCKGRNGFFHSLAFTTGNHPDPIRINAYNREVTQRACRYCHADIVHAIDSHPHTRAAERLDCIRCHFDVGHFTH